MPDCVRWGVSEPGFIGLKDLRMPDNCFSQRGPARWSSVRDRQRAVLGVMPDGNEILIGHGDGVRCCISFGCVFGGCPIVPYEMSTGSERAESGLGGNELMYCIRFFVGSLVLLDGFPPLADFLRFRQFFLVRFLPVPLW